MENQTEETEETGPRQVNIWDTRNRENSAWCDGCRKWLRLSVFSWVPKHDRLNYHKKNYCKTRTSAG